MADEPNPLPAPNPAKLSGEGALTNRQKRWIAAAIGGAVLVVLILGGGDNKPKAKIMMGPKVPRQQIVEQQQPLHAQAEAAPNWQPTPIYHPDYEAMNERVNRAPGPQQTEKQRSQSERLKREDQAAFEDNVVFRRDERTASTSAPQPSTQVATASTQVVDKKLSSLDWNGAKTYTLPEGTIIDCSLVNALNGENPGPVQMQTSNDTYARGTTILLIPQGSRVLGDAAKVSSFGQQRIAISFHRLLIGNGFDQYTVSLDKNMPGLDQEGATGLHDKVNNHYASIFGASLAIGAIGGLAQIGNGTSGYGYSPSVEFRNGISQSMAQSADRVLDRFLSRLPTITIRPGTRSVLYLTGDLSLPAYEEVHAQLR